METRHAPSRIPHDARGAWELRWVLAACLAAEVLVGWVLARPLGFWSPDSAVRFLQVEHLIRSHSLDLAIPYPAASLDPDGRYFPLGPWFHFTRAGRFFISYLPYFSIPSAALYRLFGFPGLLAIPVASGVGIVWITYHVLRRRAPGLAPAGALAVGVGTPLLIYSAVFWDHAPAVLLSAGALALLGDELDGPEPLRAWRVAAAGALLGVGLSIRSEMYLLTAAVGCAWICAAPRRWAVGLRALGSGLAVPAAGAWAANTWLFGIPVGWKGQALITGRIGEAVASVAGRTPAPWLAERLGNAYYQLASPDYYTFNGPAVVGGLILALLLGLAGLLLRLGVRKRSNPLVALGGVLGLGTGLWIVSARTDVSGLLPAAPVVVLALLPGTGSAWERFQWAVCALFTAAVIVTGTHGGMQWGPRYLLPILPALVWLAASALAHARVAAPPVWPMLRRAALALALVGVLTQALGTEQVWEATTVNARLNQWIRNLPADIVVTPIEWITLGAGPVFFEKRLMLVPNRDAFKPLVAQFAAQRVARWVYIPYSGNTFDPGVVERWTAGSPWRFRAGDNQMLQGIRSVVFTGAPTSP